MGGSGVVRGSRGERKPGQESWEDGGRPPFPATARGMQQSSLAKRYPTIKDPSSYWSRKLEIALLLSSPSQSLHQAMTVKGESEHSP